MELNEYPACPLEMLHFVKYDNKKFHLSRVIPVILVRSAMLYYGSRRSGRI